MENDYYYKNCSTTSTLPYVIDKIRKTQGDVFPVKVRFCYVDKDGNKHCESGIITGVLDNGDEVYIDAETIEHIRKCRDNEKNSSISQ